MTDLEILERYEDYIGNRYVNGVEETFISPCLVRAINAGISALRTQQEAKKNEPCGFCGKYSFANARIEVNKYGAYIFLAGGRTQFPRREQFNFCPVCGRSLKKCTPKEVNHG